MTTNSWAEDNLNRKLIEPAELEGTIPRIRQGKTLVTLNGSFDLLHAGHLQILMEAKRQGDLLLMALNSDSSIQGYKGADRPIIPLKYRLQMMAALECVDHITWFDEEDPRMLLAKVKPDVHVNGAEYGKECLEAETVRQHGGRVHIVELVPGLSTSNIIAKIGALCAPSASLKTNPKAANFPGS